MQSGRQSPAAHKWPIRRILNSIRESRRGGVTHARVPSRPVPFRPRPLTSPQIARRRAQSTEHSAQSTERSAEERAARELRGAERRGAKRGAPWKITLSRAALERHSEHVNTIVPATREPQEKHGAAPRRASESTATVTVTAQSVHSCTAFRNHSIRLRLRDFRRQRKKTTVRHALR